MADGGQKPDKVSHPHHEHFTHMAANFSTHLLSSQELFCTLFAETNVSLSFTNLLWPPGSPCIQSIQCWFDSLQADCVWYALLKGNTTVWKQTSSQDKMVCCIFEDRLESVWSLGHNDISCVQWEHQTTMRLHRYLSWCFRKTLPRR